MGFRRKLTGGLLTVLGFMLSPLSWWNDAFVNLPLALAFAWLVSSLCPGAWKEFAFDVSVMVGYWLTNLVGFVLMHHGTRQLLAKTGAPPRPASFKKDLLVSLGYTALIVLLIKLGILKPIEAYFNRGG